MKPFGFCSISNNKMINNRSETHEINININAKSIKWITNYGKKIVCE